MARRIGRSVHFGELELGSDHRDLRLIGVVFVFIDGNEDHGRVGDLKDRRGVVLILDHRIAKPFFVIFFDLADAVAGSHSHGFSAESAD